ncbi:hypothetical protein ACO0LC_23140 [Undibacterium sp. JH2W]
MSKRLIDLEVSLQTRPLLEKTVARPATHFIPAQLRTSWLQ